MNRTLFHRPDDNIRVGIPCDQASVPVVSIATGLPAGFIGCQWGEHPNPPDCVHWAIIPDFENEADSPKEKDLAQETLEAWGILVQTP